MPRSLFRRLVTMDMAVLLFSKCLSIDLHLWWRWWGFPLLFVFPAPEAADGLILYLGLIEWDDHVE